MNKKIEDACDYVGGLSKLAGLVGVKPPTVSQWKNGKRPVPTERASDIEQVTNGAVTRKDLRPDDWHRQWPELAEQEKV